MAAVEGGGNRSLVVPPNHRLQLTSAAGPSSTRELMADGDQQYAEFGTTSLAARS